MSGQDHSGAGPVNARIFPIPPVVAGLFIGAGFALNWLLPLTVRAPVPFETRIGGGLIMALRACHRRARLPRNAPPPDHHPSGP